MTWAQELALIAFERRAEGGSSTGATEEADYLRYANELIAIVSEQVGPLIHTYDSTELTLTDGAVQLPMGIVGPPISVCWDGVPLILSSKAELDALDSGWRDYEATDTPSKYLVNGMSLIVVPAVAAISLLTIEAYAQLTPFPATGAGEVLPTTFFPTAYQNLPAYFVLMNYPHDPGKPIEAARVARNAARVNGMLPAFIEVVANLGRKQFWLSD